MMNLVDIAVAAPSAPPHATGGVANAHYNLYRALADAGARTRLLTFNERGGGSEDADINRHGACAWQRKVLDICAWLYLKAKRSRGTAYQLSDILGCVPGTLKLNRSLRRWPADALIVPDHGVPALFLKKTDAALIQVSHHNPRRFLDMPGADHFSRVDVEAATALEQRALRRVDAVVCPSGYMEGVFRETFEFSGEVRVIPNAVDLQLIDEVPPFDLRAEMGLAAEAPVIYIPSAGSPFKGRRHVVPFIRRLVAGIRTATGFYLSGEIDPDLRRQLAELPACAVLHVPGRLPTREVLARVKSCSFGVSPTLIENFSMALLEASFCGVPMLTFDVGGNRELILPGENGELVPCGDLDGLVDLAGKLLEDGPDPERASRCRASVEKRFAPERIARCYLDLARSLAG
ncbi:MAG: glycosyltransferase [Deltaproteobacteria bacterium]|nr:MAG: glycosyltransferase [Deltaproteobacteria bacterium]